MPGLLCNLFGGPGAGKTTTALGVAYQLKKARINSEFVQEFAKELIWQGRIDVLKKNQTYVAGEQKLRLMSALDHVDVVVTDGPLLNGGIYRPPGYSEAFDLELVHQHTAMNTLNYYIIRAVPYDPVGRYQNEAEAREVDARASAWLDQYEIDYTAIPGDDDAPTRIMDDIRIRIAK